jgi:hypothetical protein
LIKQVDIESGYRHLDLIAREPDFTSLHDEREFQLLITQRVADEDSQSTPETATAHNDLP